MDRPCSRRPESDVCGQIVGLWGPRSKARVSRCRREIVDRSRVATGRNETAWIGRILRPHRQVLPVPVPGSDRSDSGRRDREASALRCRRLRPGSRDERRRVPIQNREALGRIGRHAKSRHGVGAGKMARLKVRAAHPGAQGRPRSVRRTSGLLVAAVRPPLRVPANRARAPGQKGDRSSVWSSIALALVTFVSFFRQQLSTDGNPRDHCAGALPSWATK